MKQYKVVLKSWGGTKHDFCTNLTYGQALELCEEYGWEYNYDGSYIWDLEIEEEV